MRSRDNFSFGGGGGVFGEGGCITHRLLRIVLYFCPVPLASNLDTWSFRSFGESIYGENLTALDFNGWRGKVFLGAALVPYYFNIHSLVRTSTPTRFQLFTIMWTSSNGNLWRVTVPVSSFIANVSR